jgi:hypothetical protein
MPMEFRILVKKVLNYDISHHMNKSVNKIKEEVLKLRSENKKQKKELINILQLINRNLITKKNNRKL